jgi:hypothetical protein
MGKRRWSLVVSSWQRPSLTPGSLGPEAGIPFVNLLSKKGKASLARLVQIQLVPAITGSRLSGMSNAAVGE